MADRYAVKVTGLDGIQKKLKALPKAVERKVLRSALRAGAGVIRAEARDNVAVDTGSLKKKIAVKEGDPKKYGGGVVMSVGVEKGSFFATRKRDGGVKYKRLRKGDKVQKKARGKITPARYAHLVELGTAHSAPKPFLRPAVDSKKEETMAAIEKKGREAFDKAVRELGK